MKSHLQEVCEQLKRVVGHAETKLLRLELLGQSRGCELIGCDNLRDLLHFCRMGVWEGAEVLVVEILGCLR